MAFSRDFSNLVNKSCSVNLLYGLETVFLISKGNPLTAIACVRNIRIAVVVSVPKSLNNASDLFLNLLELYLPYAHLYNLFNI